MLVRALLIMTLVGGSTASAQTSLYWGDTHVHSSYSLDANLFGNTRLDPEAAFRFARGEAIDTGGGRMAQLSRPLHFLLVSDHASYLKVFPMIRAGDALVAGTETAQRIGAVLAANERLGPEHIRRLTQMLDGETELRDSEPVRRSAWDDVIDIAERMNTPGQFTAFVGFEWGSTPDGNNLHRNVIFRDGPDRTKQVLPFTAADSDEPEKLWEWLAEYQTKTGGQAFAIPHNSNLSNGLMFGLRKSNRKRIDAEWARTRAEFEPLIEVTQIKGDSEAHPFLSPDDAFADYGTWDKTNIFGLARTEPEMAAGSYARPALKNGLILLGKVGANPYAFGLIGSTDSHTSLATADEDNFWGKTSSMLLGDPRAEGPFIQPRDEDAQPTMNWEQVASGYAAVWASANTREAIFDALRRREAYATTGPRMAVRFFGGWTYADEDASSADLAAAGYAQGVPMGGTLPAAPADAKGPVFLLGASKDPESANLQRIQIIKGWADAEGQAHELVYDAALAPDRSAGIEQLQVAWRDPGFNPAVPAFYYARVIEVESARWTALDAQRFGHPTPPGTRMTHQERAYTSPIWYVPARE